MIALFHTIVIAMGIRHIMIKTYAVVKDVVDSLLYLPSSSCELFCRYLCKIVATRP